MKRTKVISISVPEEVITEVEHIAKNPEFKFYSKSSAYSYLLNLGINSFNDGQRLVSFIDRILGNKTTSKTNENGKHNK